MNSCVPVSSKIYAIYPGMYMYDRCSVTPEKFHHGVDYIITRVMASRVTITVHSVGAWSEHPLNF